MQKEKGRFFMAKSCKNLRKVIFRGKKTVISSEVYTESCCWKKEKSFHCSINEITREKMRSYSSPVAYDNKELPAVVYVARYDECV